MNYGNKNSTCPYTNEDIAKGYAAAVSSALVVSLTLRKLTGGLLKSATGNKLLILNAATAASAGAVASFLNTAAMRGPEIKKGITVYSDFNTSKEIGIS